MIRHVTEGDAVERLLAGSETEMRDHKTISTERFSEVRAALAIVQACLHQKSLDPDLEQALLERGLLPTESRGEIPWQQVLFTRASVPPIEGAQAPSVIDVRLARLPMFQQGKLKLQRYRLDEYLKRLNFEKAGAGHRDAFFSWFREHYSSLQPPTLRKLAQAPFWPTEDGRHVTLSDFCLPTAGAIRSLVAEVTPKPSPSVLTFPGLRKSGRGALALRRTPKDSELLAWYTLKREMLAAEPIGSTRVREVLAELERGLNAILKHPTRKTMLSEIAQDHETLTRASTLEVVRNLHLPSQTVEACRLLPTEVADGSRRKLYAALGARSEPSSEALRRALLHDPQPGAILYRRLDLFVRQDKEPKRLAQEPIIPVDGSALRPGDLTLYGAVDLWGSWKRNLPLKEPTPHQVDTLVSVGVVRQTLSESLSRGFFEWVSHQSSQVQRQHLPQIMRHWRDGARGPLKWWGQYPQLRCLPVRGHDDTFDLVSRAMAVGHSSLVYLPDLPTLNEKILERDPKRWLAITDVEGISGTLLAPLRAANLSSLRAAVGRPVKLSTSGEFEPAQEELKELISRISSETMVAELPKDSICTVFHQIA